ncbi:hypothetical protein H0N96_00135 [Candidatus Micrarchaeota archaeon]|nr:hypothetical protein [Candidatus Micrarchaeota archaeon]
MVEEKTSPRRGNGVWLTLEQKLNGRKKVLEKINRFIAKREEQFYQAEEDGDKFLVTELKEHLNDLREQERLHRRFLTTLERALELRERGLKLTGERADVVKNDEDHLEQLAEKISEKFVKKYAHIKPLP